jgi:hypothetical protein
MPCQLAVQLSGVADLVQKRQRDRVPVFRHDLKRRLDSVAIVDVHQPRASVAPDRGLDVVRDHRAARGAIRPEPHEWRPGDALSPQAQQQEPLENPIDGVVHRPARERTALEATEVGPLERPAHRRRHEAPEGVVEPLLPATLAESVGARRIGGVALHPEIVDDLRRVERHTKDARIGSRRRRAVRRARRQFSASENRAGSGHSGHSCRTGNTANRRRALRPEPSSRTAPDDDSSRPARVRSRLGPHSRAPHCKNCATNLTVLLNTADVEHTVHGGIRQLITAPAA